LHSPFNVGSASLCVYLHGCAVACVWRATKQTFAQYRIFLEEPPLLVVTENVTIRYVVCEQFWNRSGDIVHEMVKQLARVQVPNS